MICNETFFKKFTAVSYNNIKPQENFFKTIQFN